MQTSDRKRMVELVELLNQARRVYEQGVGEMMSDMEYDKKYDELVELEKKLGITLASSPTVHVGYEVIGELPKEHHSTPMLSLDKTKEVARLEEFVHQKEAVLSWKLDGLTVVLTYQQGALVKAATRGNGEVGEVITNNARTFKNLPLRIPYQGDLILRGEAVIGFSDFAKINREIEDVSAKYKNPRNLCSGSVRQLNSEITAKRRVRFFAFAIVSGGEDISNNSRCRQLEWLGEQGFAVVEHELVSGSTVVQEVQKFSGKVAHFDFPTDGLVLTYDDIAYGQSLGSTAKTPRDSIAFKWADEMQETTLLEMEWSPSRTGLINPVAIFEPVELEGTVVSRASVHNISIMEELELGVGDRIKVYKANMIIPQIAENLTRSGVSGIPDHCPVCGGATQIDMESNTKTLHCQNPNCQAKQLKLYELFVSRNALNVEGLSSATLEKFVQKGFIKEVTDLFHLARFAEEIKEMEGFGEKSYDNLIDSVEQARRTTLPRLVYGLGIPHVGATNARLICRTLQNDPNKMVMATAEELAEISGIGEVIGRSFASYFSNPKHREVFMRLLTEVSFPEEEASSEEATLANVNVVITGSVEHFPNRAALKEWIESRGGKVTGSVTSKTSYLINNDTGSTSSKNRKAQELGVPILSEEDFLQMYEA